MDHQNKNDFGEHELKILVTDADKCGFDITEMSDFFDGYIHQLMYELTQISSVDIVVNIPVGDLCIINEVVHHANAVMEGEFCYLPDFDHLPADIRTKLDQGIYKVGESRQVDGNMRAVILNENDIRIKDITLKKVLNDSSTLETTRNISNQLQLRQINAKLDSIQAFQNYQIDRDRDTAILCPFFVARGYILQAQEQSIPKIQQEYLKKAADALATAITNVYLEMRTSTKHLVKWTRMPIFQPRSLINRISGFIAQDIQLATKYVGVQVHIYNYLGDITSAKAIVDQYQERMKEFFFKDVTRDGLSISDVIHMNFPYNDSNRDCWFNLKREMSPVLLAGTKGTVDKQLYLISMEDVDHDEACKY